MPIGDELAEDTDNYYHSYYDSVLSLGDEILLEEDQETRKGRELQPSNRMYKNYKYYRSWVYSNGVYNQLKTEYPDQGELSAKINEKAENDKLFDSREEFRVSPPAQETDYFRKEYYAETYASREKIKLINEVCASHMECGSRCCPELGGGGTKVCRMNEEINGKWTYQECYDFE